MGDTAFNFDSTFAETPSAGVAMALLDPDHVGSDDHDPAGRTDLLRYSFSGLSPGRFARWRMDLDRDDVDETVDYRAILFDLGGASDSDNAVATVTFSTGRSWTHRLPDFAPAPDDSYLAADMMGVLPEPRGAGMALLLAGLSTLRRCGWVRTHASGCTWR